MQIEKIDNYDAYSLLVRATRSEVTRDYLPLVIEFSLIMLINYQIGQWRKGGISLHKKEPEFQIGSLFA
ncbi:MAG TPA: hypothetical protein VD710_05795 [Nitrososphaeraceae archaeon]|nr:hypothetical protein [Nitrososphaeraceae archaeon]